MQSIGTLAPQSKSLILHDGLKTPGAHCLRSRVQHSTRDIIAIVLEEDVDDRSHER